MLAYLLALVVGIGSMTFYLSAFILPEVHRRSDFFWSGVGLFYALVLWACAGQMGGALLVGPTASVALLLGLGYQTLGLRRMTTPAAQQTPIRLGRSGRSPKPLAPRSSVNDYEFVEDGVADGTDGGGGEPAEPAAPTILQTESGAAVPRLVVPAAIPTPPISQSKDPPKPSRLQDEEPQQKKTTPRQQRPGPVKAVGIFIGWLKEVLTPQPKPAKPVIELPPRPPSIPASPPQTDSSGPPMDSQADKATDAVQPAPAEASAQLSQPPGDGPPAAQSEGSWPDDDFWE